ncbi:MAG: hypothetical protein JRH10_02825 [Deltaproteobacteria bacterium]|nr:hypothetical protein [Deltaproteobacteria bacterium]MBW2445722.1 hypothetical protein [Deltaproteobacteria bacterium]
MARPKETRGSKGGSGLGVMVEDGATPRPFMRGIMIHSLIRRGVPYEEAFEVAQTVRDRIKGRPSVKAQELAELASELLPAGLPTAVPELAEPIRITDAGASVPFSKGILSQSLLAAALEPGDAWEVARDIELELRRSRTLEIDRKSLRRLAFETLTTRVGKSAGRDYLMWRRFQDPERPVILLLGGPTGAGKTSLALEVGHRLGIPRVMSTDTIRQVMRIMLSSALAPALHASSYDAWRAIPDAESFEDPIVEGFRDQAQVVSVGVRGLIDRAVAENTSLILDGVSIVPGLMGRGSYAETADVIMMMVVNLGEEAYAGRFEARRRSPKHQPHDYVENLDAILQIQDHLLELAEQVDDVPVVNNEDFEQSVQTVIRHVAKTLRERHGFDAAELL